MKHVVNVFHDACVALVLARFLAALEVRRLLLDNLLAPNPCPWSDITRSPGSKALIRGQLSAHTHRYVLLRNEGASYTLSATFSSYITELTRFSHDSGNCEIGTHSQVCVAFIMSSAMDESCEPLIYDKVTQ